MPIQLASDDDSLAALVGSEIASQKPLGGYYRIDRSIGEGGMSIAFLAMRIAADGIVPVVMKMPRPQLLRHGSRAELSIRKEAVALQRLNERVPPTPFVVRLIDVGSLHVELESIVREMTWLSIEYVHGGVEGTTLEQRVRTTIRRSGSAFDPWRAALAIDCMCRGVRAIHEVGVFHRDLTPRNVLCCGFGDSEMFKIADFGIARPAGMNGTFGSSMPFLGTPGYAPPEQLSPDDRQVGTWSDVFSLGCLIFFVLTGEGLFPANSVAQAIAAPHRPERRSILETQALSPVLRSRPQACRAIDEIIAATTASDRERRPSNPGAVSTLMGPLLRSESDPRRSPDARARRIIASDAPPEMSRRWAWTTKCQGSSDRIVRNAAWDGDGRCLVATTRGLEFWNGTEWSVASTEGLLDDGAVHLVHRMSAGRWLVGGDGPSLVVLTTTGATPVMQGPDAAIRWRLAGGEIRDLAVIIAHHPGAGPVLHALCGTRWLKPMPLPDVTSVTSLARLDDEHYLLAGEAAAGGGWLSIARPTSWSMEAKVMPAVRSFRACAADVDRRSGMFAGTAGTVVVIDEKGFRERGIEGAGDLSAAAVDAAGTQWAGGIGQIWRRALPSETTWELAWSDPASTTPWVSLLADLGIVRALGVDGAVVEGRFEAITGTAPFAL